MFEKGKEYEVTKHGVETILKINYLEKENFPSIEDDAIVMKETIKKLIQVPNTTKIIFIHSKNYEYEYNQIVILKEIALLYSLLSKQKELFEALKKAEESDRLKSAFLARKSSTLSALLVPFPH